LFAVTPKQASETSGDPGKLEPGLFSQKPHQKSEEAESSTDRKQVLLDIHSEGDQQQNVKDFVGQEAADTLARESLDSSLTVTGELQTPRSTNERSECVPGYEMEAELTRQGLFALMSLHSVMSVHTYLPTVPEFLGQTWKLTSHPAVPETFKIVQEIIHVASA